MQGHDICHDRFLRFLCSYFDKVIDLDPSVNFLKMADIFKTPDQFFWSILFGKSVSQGISERVLMKGRTAEFRVRVSL